MIGDWNEIVIEDICIEWYVHLGLYDTIANHVSQSPLPLTYERGEKTQMP